MPRTSAYKIRIRTDSADSNAVMLLDDGELVAILTELADETHGSERGQWIIETIFGLNGGRWPGTFVSAAAAADWVGENVCHHAFVLDRHLAELG